MSNFKQYFNAISTVQSPLLIVSTLLVNNELIK